MSTTISPRGFCPAARRRAVLADVPTGSPRCGGGVRPSLATILVGDDDASAGYIRIKQRQAAELGFASPHRHLPADATQDELHAVIAEFNADPAVHGVLIQHPIAGRTSTTTPRCRARPGQGRRRDAPAQHGSPRARPARPAAVHAGRHRGAAGALRDPGRRSRGRDPRPRRDARTSVRDAAGAEAPDRQRRRHRRAHRRGGLAALHPARRHPHRRRRRARHHPARARQARARS